MALPQLNTAVKYELKVPSSGEMVEYRPYLVKEEKILMLAMESEDQRQIIRATRDIITSCTFEQVDIMKQPMFDLEYIFLKLRAKSVGETSKLKFSCEKCQTPNDYDINLDELEPIGSQVENTIALTDTIGVTMKYPTLKDIDGDTLTGEINIEKTYKMIENSIESIYEGETVHLAKDLEKNELTEFLDNLTADQMKKLTAFYNSMPRLEHKVMVTNPKTKVESEVTIKGLASFFV